jgi:hypothetical protein
MVRRGQGRGVAGGAPADDPPARPSGPSLPARRRHPRQHPITSVTRPEGRLRKSRKACPRTQCDALHPRHKTVAFSCCQTIGLDTTANSIPYLTSWAQDASLEVLEQTAALTGRLCDRIEGVLLADPASFEPGDQEVLDAPKAVAV